MSDQELYDIARQKIDRRNRRWIIWFIHLALFVGYVGLFILLTDTELVLFAVAALIAWGGLFALHTFVTATADSRDKDIEAEVAKLRQVVYEKPKRVELAEDGELVDFDEDEQPAQAASNARLAR